MDSYDKCISDMQLCNLVFVNKNFERTVLNKNQMIYTYFTGFMSHPTSFVLVDGL